MPERTKILVLDAMGVIYAVGDDVRDLLCPYILEKGGCRDISKIVELYRITSLGKMTSSEFWSKVGLDPGMEDDYLQKLRLADGLLDFLSEIIPGRTIFCLSNDVSEWSKKLRNRFDLAKYIDGFVISGDVGFRKPDPAIFKKLLDQAGADSKAIIMVDDSPRNLDTAAELGMATILFRSPLFPPLIPTITNNRHKIAADFGQLKSCIVDSDRQCTN